METSYQKQISYQKEWRRLNKNKVNTRQSQWRKLNKDKVNAYQKVYRTDNAEIVREQRRSYDRKHPIRRMLMQAKIRAKKLGLVFNLTEQDLEVPTHCPVLGIELFYINTKGKRNNTASLDRVFLTKGYTKDNTRIISMRANRLKNNGSLEELKSIVVYLERVQDNQLNE